MSTIEKALEIAAIAHAGVRDDHNIPYILHPLRVMMGVQGEDAQIVAILHDVVEDTNITLEDLGKAGFSPHILAAIDCVTHRKGEPYAEYVIRCKPNPIARQVKLSDLRDNSKIERTIIRPTKVERDLKRLRRYVLSYQYLTDELSESAYREQMVSAEK